MRLIPIYVFIFLIGVVIAQGIYYLPVMPETMATHFGTNGEADGFSTKTGFFIFETIILLVVVLCFTVMPWALEHFKVRKSLNLPNKEYWTAPERIDLFYTYFRNSFAWFGVATLVLFIGALQLTFEANFLPKPILNMKIFLILFISYIAFVIIWTISFIRKFSKTE